MSSASTICALIKIDGIFDSVARVGDFGISHRPRFERGLLQSSSRPPSPENPSSSHTSSVPLVQPPDVDLRSPVGLVMPFIQYPSFPLPEPSHLRRTASESTTLQDADAAGFDRADHGQGQDAEKIAAPAWWTGLSPTFAVAMKNQQQAEREEQSGPPRRCRRTRERRARVGRSRALMNAFEKKVPVSVVIESELPGRAAAPFFAVTYTWAHKTPTVDGTLVSKVPVSVVIGSKNPNYPVGPPRPFCLMGFFAVTYIVQECIDSIIAERRRGRQPAKRVKSTASAGGHIDKPWSSVVLFTVAPSLRGYSQFARTSAEPVAERRQHGRLVQAYEKYNAGPSREETPRAPRMRILASTSVAEDDARAAWNT
ncbi:hypothetical protein PG985_008545 [Apiospora marii]|uniref:Uncharacterized protein n=1 Tax=Apiospora marii TaxID=335849 RepID=A0ABR1R2T1_9PEZI